MKPRTVVIIGLAGVALAIVYKEQDKITSSDPCFREGYFAGWFTPGPITIVALSGLAYFYA